MSARASTPLRRRRVLVSGLLAVVAVPALSACAQDEPEPVGPAPITEVGAEAPSPSGQYVAVIDAAGDAVGVLLRDGSGQDLWADDYGYTRAEPPALLWELEADVLWVIGPEEGTADDVRIVPGDEGGFVREPVTELPEEIAGRL